MLKRIFAAAALTCLCACAGAPERAEPSWTEMRLRDKPGVAAPAYIPRETLSEGARITLAGGEEESLEARDRVRLEARQLTTPTVDTADFVVEARERALPPPQ